MKRTRIFSAVVLTVTLFAATASFAHASPAQDWLTAAMPTEKSAQTLSLAIADDLANHNFNKLATDGQAYSRLLDQWTTLPPAPADLVLADRYMGRSFAFMTAGITAMNDAIANNDAIEFITATTLINRATDDTMHLTAAIKVLAS